MSEKLTYDQLMALIQAETARAKEDVARIKAQAEEDHVQMEAMHRRMEESSAKTERKIRAVSKQIGSAVNNNGAAAENYFYNSFKKSKEFGGEKFDRGAKNLPGWGKDLQDEYDIVLSNGKSIGIIEVKYRAEKKHIAQTINKATTFRQCFPMYKDFTFYLGLASFVFTEEVEKAALDAGLAVIKQVGKTMVVQDERMKKF